jgi:uncharacterized protein (TIGR02118 family)
MYKTVSCWSAPRPEDEAAFEECYWSTHVPAAQRVPFVSRVVLTRTSEGVGGNAPAFYRVAEMWFAGEDDYERATRTTEWAELRLDGARIRERFGVTLASGLGVPVELAASV